MMKARWNGQRLPANLVGGGAMLFVIVFVAMVGPLGGTSDPFAINFDVRFLPPGPNHPFGTDHLGRDVLSRVLHGAAIDLQMGIALVLPALLIGSTLGLVAGYRGGIWEVLVMRISEILQAFPSALLTICLIGILGFGMQQMYIVGAVAGWIAYARLVRSEVLVLKKSNYILAARALGSSEPRILVRHILPHVIVQVLVFSSTSFIQSILLGSSLGFLGLGVQPPSPEWGFMIAEGQIFLTEAPWICIFPALAFMALGAAVSLVGDGLASYCRAETRLEHER